MKRTASFCFAEIPRRQDFGGIHLSILRLSKALSRSLTRLAKINLLDEVFEGSRLCGEVSGEDLERAERICSPHFIFRLPGQPQFYYSKCTCHS